MKRRSSASFAGSGNSSNKRRDTGSSLGLRGEDFGQRVPPIYDIIKNILQEYPSGQIFKEVIQNADDARATEVKFYLDYRNLETLPISLLQSQSGVSARDQEELSKQFTGPALLSYNNAPFREEDWEGIQTTYQSVKANSPNKVGKFGIGFNSVYHITDLPVIISEDTCVFLEPQLLVWSGMSGQRYSLESLSDYCTGAVLPFIGIEGFSSRLSNFKGKTIFRFPLRKKPSKIWGEIYDISKLESLLSSLKQEAKYLLLFLRSVCSIEVLKINARGVISSIFNVSISQEHRSLHIQNQQKILRAIEDLTSKASSLTLYGQMHIHVESSHFKVAVKDNETQSHIKHEFLVIHQVGSNNQKVRHLAEKQNVLPWVGVAVELNNLIPNFGRIFCVLPLPVEDRSPFYIHVNGTFAISSNRRSIKWEAQERRHDEQAMWNKMLVEDCLPFCYFKLISKLMDMKSPEVYNYWPDIEKVSGTQWGGLLKPFYNFLFSHNKIVYTQLDGGKWINITEAVFAAHDVPKAVIEALLRCNVNLVMLSGNCIKAIINYYTGTKNDLSPALAKIYLKRYKSAYSSVTRKDKLDILRYCLVDSNYADLVGLWLLPMADGSFQEFKRIALESSSYLCSPDYPSSLLPGLESKLVKMYDEDQKLYMSLYTIALYGQTQLVLLNEMRVSTLLVECNTRSWSQDQLRHFWEWLNKRNLSPFKNNKILPVKLPSGSTNVLELKRQAGVVYIPQFLSSFGSNKQIVAGFKKCGIKFADSRDFPYLSHSELSEYIYQFDPNEILDAMESFTFGSINFLQNEALALQQFFSSSSFYDLNKLSTFSEMPLFEVLQCSDLTRYSLNLIKSYNNQVIAMNGRYEFKTDLIEKYPFIIDTYSHNDVQLLKALYNANVLCFMSETDYLLQIAFQQIRNGKFHNVVPFMLSVLDNFSSPRYKQQIAGALRDLPFIKTALLGAYKAPCNLFDPENEFLVKLFNGEDKFPGAEFKPYLPILRECGLKLSVSASEIYQIVNSICLQSTAGIGIAKTSSVLYSKAMAVLRYLSSFPDKLSQKVSTNSYSLLVELKRLNAQSCWLPVASKHPDEYPSCLEWRGSQYQFCLASAMSIANPLMLVSEDLSSSHLPLIAGSQALFVEGVPAQLVGQLGRSQALITAIVSHFNEVIKNEHKIRKDLLLKISVETYTYLQENRVFCSVNTFAAIDNWVFIKNKFLRPQQIAIEANPNFEANLEPFVYVLPSNLSSFADIFSLFGINHQVTPQQIFDVLQSIKYAPRNQINAAKAWTVVTAILEWLAEDINRIGDGNVLVPVESKSSYPNLIPAEEVAYTNNEVLCNIANASGEEYHLIHPKVSHLSAELGIAPLSDQLNITEDIFDDAGQHEPITTRLRNILKEYKDGLTIIKEMIQNADDAGATEVNILYDNRTHSTQNLILKGMADSHGPALIVHNNGTFTKEDFENITKLAGATKANQPLKIGKFGIGFCSVYHITDVPSFVSGEWLYIFDPTLQFLKGVVHDQSKPGKKIKYQQSKIFSNCQDLVPYEGLFGFSSLSDYEGTMFRFPFRTSASQISSTVYNEHLVEDIKRDLIECGSKLLLFLQHVKRITFSSLRGNEKIIEVSIDVSSSSNDDIHEVVINSPHNGSGTEHWLIASQEEQWRHQNNIEPAVASVACQLDRINSNCYKCKEIEGNAFCFLPLALPSTGLPVHVSANFAVMSNRSGIWTEVLSGTVTDSKERWNKNLMEKTIPEAYCKLLQKLQAMHCSGTLLNYEFYFLWPLAKCMKYPWVSLVEPLINILSEQKLFYSASLNKWQTLEQSCFIPSPLFSIAGKCSFPEEALSILQLPVVSLPPDHMQQLQNLNDSLHVLNENEFTSCFLSNIASFDAHIQICNEIIFCMLLAIAMSEEIDPNKYENVKSEVKKFPCIPCSPNGMNLKVANQLIDPVVFTDIFDPDDATFPLASFCQNNLVRNLLLEFGMMSKKLSMDIIIKSAETIRSIIVIDKSKAMKRVKAILQYITSPVPDELKKMRFLPVLPKPEDYFMHWKGEGHILLSPNELICDSRSTAKSTALTVGSQRAILNTNSVSDGGCGTVGQRVIKLLEIATKPSFDEVLEHFNTLIHSFKPSASREIIYEMCRVIYTFFDESLENRVLYQSLSKYSNKQFIWTGKAFVCPRDVAVNWKHDDGPYLYKLPSMLSEQNNLLSCLKIKKDFNYEDILVAFEKMYKEFESHQLQESVRDIALSMISELNSMTIDSSQVSDYKRDIILIDNSFTLRQVSQLSFNDSPWLPPDNESFFVHNKLTREVALTLGVKPTCSRFLNKFAPQSQQSFVGVPFGQKEELTRRIRNILQEYPLDATFLKELLQNADDAKATKIRVILDKRQHKKEKVPSEEWGKELQGPALLVWNDKEFSDADLEGIQKLGLGSKRDDDESIGQFGIGFNVVYHLTDCPSFITRGNTLCVFDPHCRYIPEADHSCPGRRYNIDDNFLEGMSHLKSSFLRVSPSNIHLPDNLTTGTLFRFPLRTQSGLQSTELLDKTAFKKHISVSVMEEKLTNWVNEIEDALLFLNHIKKFSFYIIDDKHSSLKLSYEISISEEDQQQREGFHQKLLSFKTSKEPFIVTYPIQLTIVKPHNGEVTKRWLIQNGVGNLSKSPTEQLSLDRVQPKYGIAAPLDRDTRIYGRVFCFLPLPVFTNLPVHVNGQFALNNNRRSLWNGDKEDNKIKWNRFIIQAIAYCYALLLDKARSYFISESESGDSERLEGDWHKLVLNVVQHLYDSNISVLAIQALTSQIFDKLNFDERMCHMEYIRKSLFPNLKHALQMTGKQSEQAKKFVNCARNLPFLVSHSNDDELYPVNHFVDHTMEIFNSFSDRFHFLAEEYRKEEWLDFLRFIGLRTKVAPEEFVEFCDEVSKNHCKDTSTVLVEYLFSTKATAIHKSPALLSKICEIPFVCTADLSPLSWIAPPYSAGFTCLNEAVGYEDAPLLWTVRPVIKLPKYSITVLKNRKGKIVMEPSVTDVFENIINISKSDLADFNLMSTYKLPSVSRTSDKASIVKVIKDNITFILDHNSNLLKELSSIPFIPVSAERNDDLEISKPVLLNSMQVIMSAHSPGSEQSTRFCPYINDLPISLHDSYSALSKAGVTYKVELKHIRYMLEKLHQQCKNINNPNDKKLVRNAMQALFELLKDVTQETEKILEPLYLPSIDDQLVLSTKLVYLDRKVYFNHESEWDFSNSQFKLFYIPLSDNELSEKELCCKLPKKLSPKRLSSVSHDELESGTTLQSHSRLCEQLKYLTNFCSYYTDGVTKIFVKVLPHLSEPNAIALVNFIKNLKFETVTDFTTCVMIDSIKVGIIKPKFLFINEDGIYTLYSSDEISNISKTLRKGLAHELCNVLARAVNDEAIKLDEVIYEFLDVQTEEDFKLFMEEYGQNAIVNNEYEINADDSMPEPGQPMGRYWESFLFQNADNIFRPQEWVGYERKDDDFIWAIILHEVQQEDAENQYSKKYAIQIDNEDEIHEEIVFILSLFKLVRHEAPLASPNHHQGIALHSGIHQATSEARAETENDNLRSLKKKICEQLRLLWRLPDTERRRGVRRLYLQYHPDKADPSKVSIYEEAFKFFKSQINRMENNLHPDVTESSSHHTETNFGSHWESNFNQWDRSARNRRYGHSGSGGGGSFGGSSFSRPQQSNTTQDRVHYQ
uniref:Sacsin/Nov domain-containing protein n=1 Tax=Amphimedon queenslandica TaxID=400682 RepID=A0A1X7UXC8_AMPQE